jgi:hypothetical protein
VNLLDSFRRSGPTAPSLPDYYSIRYVDNLHVVDA